MQYTGGEEFVSMIMSNSENTTMNMMLSWPALAQIGWKRRGRQEALLVLHDRLVFQQYHCLQIWHSIMLQPYRVMGRQSCKQAAWVTVLQQLSGGQKAGVSLAHAQPGCWILWHPGSGNPASQKANGRTLIISWPPRPSQIDCRCTTAWSEFCYWISF